MIIDNKMDNNNLCSICLESFCKKNIQTICKHHFHYDCLKKWLEKNTSCPYCRCHIGKIDTDTDNKPYMCLGVPPWRYYSPINSL